MFSKHNIILGKLNVLNNFHVWLYETFTFAVFLCVVFLIHGFGKWFLKWHQCSLTFIPEQCYTCKNTFQQWWPFQEIHYYEKLSINIHREFFVHSIFLSWSTFFIPFFHLKQRRQTYLLLPLLLEKRGGTYYSAAWPWISQCCYTDESRWPRLHA